MCDVCKGKITHLNEKIESIQNLKSDTVMHDLVVSMDYHEWCTSNVTIKPAKGDYCKYEVTIKNLSERSEMDIFQSQMLDSLYKNNLYLKLIRYDHDAIVLMFNDKEYVCKI